IQARAAGDAEAVARAGNELETAILNAAAAMRRKYGTLPGVADVAIMFLPVEGLYAEVLLRSALCRSLHRDYRVVIASPATLDTLLAGDPTGPAAARV
ncbi:MAG: DNA recombination protein RmuC, partial [candidate division WOR-3 bacterium]